jgi:nitrate reductase gamma subunit
MTLILYSFIYDAVLIFLIASVARAIRYARAPLHLRWELYPVPHEDPSLVEHGGSYFEKVDWWKQPLHFNLWGELKFMVPEMLFLKGLWEFNRGLWWRSFPFHFGLYLLFGTAVLVAGSAWLGTAALHPLYTATGLVGAVGVMVGALGLLVRRLTDPNLKNYTAPADVFNLVLFLAVIGLLLAGYFLRPPDFTGALGLARGLLVFDTTVRVPGLLASGLLLGSVLLAYIPLTHMSHFIAKYFTYHSIRWDDAPNRGEAKLAAKIAECLSYRPTWAAAHMGADGTRTWAEIATTNPAAGAKK